MSADLGAVTYTAVTWTAGDVITEAKLDNMVANDQGYDSHSAQGLSLNNEKALAGALADDTLINLVKLNSDDEQVSGGRDSGWNLVDQTWAYLSATTITVPAGAVSIYQKGDKVRLKQGAGWKYFYIVGVADTVLTVTGGSDYTVADATITVPHYSHATSPIGFPQWFDLADPTYNVSFFDDGSGGQPTTTEFRFTLNGTTATVRLRATGTKGNAGSSIVAIPIASTGLPPLDTSLYTGRNCVGSSFTYEASYSVGITMCEDVTFYGIAQASVVANTTINSTSLIFSYEI